MTAPRRALIVVDVQQEYFTGILQIQAPSRDEALANVVIALEAAEQRALPVVVVQHQLPKGSPVFAVGSKSWALHPEIEQRLKPSWKRVTKDKGSVFAGTDVAAWLADQGVDTITIVGYMTNNCDQAAESRSPMRAPAANQRKEKSTLPRNELTTEGQRWMSC